MPCACSCPVRRRSAGDVGPHRARDREPLAQTLEQVVGDGGRRLDLDRAQTFRFVDQQIDFQADVVAPEKEVGRVAGIEAGLEKLGDDQCFEKGRRAGVD
jgi:hypothetical protein